MKRCKLHTHTYRQVSKRIKAHTHTHTHTHIYIYIYIYTFMNIFTADEKSHFILSAYIFLPIDDLSIAFPAFSMRMLTSLSVDVMLLLRCVSWCTNFKFLPFYVLSVCTLFYWHSRWLLCYHLHPLSWTNPRSKTQQNSSSTVTCFPCHKHFK